MATKCHTHALRCLFIPLGGKIKKVNIDLLTLIEEWLKNVDTLTIYENDVYSNNLWLEFGGENIGRFSQKTLIN